MADQSLPRQSWRLEAMNHDGSFITVATDLEEGEAEMMARQVSSPETRIVADDGCGPDEF